MAGASLLALIDKIAVVLDDVALMTKVAAKNTAGVLGDDLALNAQQVSGVNADRELPVVWAVAKGSAKNKLILVPAALVISAVVPWLITPLLMLGGAYLCFEGFEKIWHSCLSLFKATNGIDDEHQQALQALLDPEVDMVSYEREKIAGAIRTDFILSAEIIVIALGTVKDAAIINQVLVVSTVAAVMTAGVYGLVAAIVKLDDAGLYLLQKPGSGHWHQLRQGIGRGLLSFAPTLMRSLTVIGTIAMFLVGGSILAHGLPPVHHLIAQLAADIASFHALLAAVNAITLALAQGLLGVIAGALVYGGVKVGSALWRQNKTSVQSKSE